MIGRTPIPITRRATLVIGLVIAGIVSYIYLDLSLQTLIPSPAGWKVAANFFRAALHPALTSQADFVPEGTPPLLVIGWEAAQTTFVFAAAALGLALFFGVLLGFISSTAWWGSDPIGGANKVARGLQWSWRRTLFLAARTLIAFMRSIHEIVWALLFLAAMGINQFACVLAIAIPYAGTFAKIFSELVDESPRGAATALKMAGASDGQVYAIALLPQAFPDLIAYTFYRLECALRSSAVLGFFGFPTLGLEIRQSFRSGNYEEVWTFLYLLIAMVLIFDAWSSLIRSRLTS